jgi:uroporphyrinogen decarboxylase
MPPLHHRARLEMCLSGVRPDRTPVALWRHFPVDDQDPIRLAAATAVFQRTFDFDLVKVTPSSSFCIRGWGIRDEWRGEPEGTRAYIRRAVTTPEDWIRLATLSPTQAELGAQLECLRLLMREFSPDTPVIQTLFSPLAQAKNLAGPAELLAHLRKWPDAVHAGLRTITETTLRFLSETRKTGIDGIFYAVQHAQFGLLNDAEFHQFGSAYDLPILEAAQGLWLNMVHLHGKEIMFDAVAGYPCAVLNWHDRETEPGLKDALERFPGAVCGGLRQWDTMVLGTPETVRQEARQAIESAQGIRLILGTGCVTPTTAPYGNLLAARQAVE